jgi:hypothetical protein
MRLNRAYYSNSIEGFLEESNDQILGELVRGHAHVLEELQRNAWISQIRILKVQLATLGRGHLFLEYSIPRMGKRADAIILLDGFIIVLEFKVGASNFDRAGKDQVIDYALDLWNFHEGSHQKLLFPVLVATQGPEIANEGSFSDSAGVTPCVLANESNLGRKICDLVGAGGQGVATDPMAWGQSRYRPTPTIIEAAQALYYGHNVEEISRSDAGAINLSETTLKISEIIEMSKAKRVKSICFLTGVPGAGKTLAGLNLACARQKVSEDEHAVFLSGNGPLVDVLREALARNQAQHEEVTLRDARIKTKAFIQNIHHFRDDSLASKSPPIERVVVFDEAQRAWDREHLARFMAERKGIQGFSESEPEFLIAVMDRIPDWCTVVALVGGGQEINSGEAGLSEWLSAFARRFKHWRIYFSPMIGQAEYAIGGDVNAVCKDLNWEVAKPLHLGVSLRSFRSEHLSAFVHALLDNDAVQAKKQTEKLSRYPIILTRDLQRARTWLREQAKGNELKGLLAASGALRLKADGVYVKSRTGAVEWFLNPKDDVRSCHYLEDVGTEFDVQGLELDWACVCWDLDLRRTQDSWGYKQFLGSTWRNINQPADRRYLINTYRVLLTRARQGMVIYVPKGSGDDPTRPPTEYDKIADYLKACGIGCLT